MYRVAFAVAVDGFGIGVAGVEVVGRFGVAGVKIVCVFEVAGVDVLDVAFIDFIGAVGIGVWVTTLKASSG